MKSVTQLKGLGDVRTSVSTHARSTPRQKGDTYLEVYLLDKERQRLDTELAMLAKRQDRIGGRLREIARAMGDLRSQRQEGLPAPPAPAEEETPTGREGRSSSAPWKGMVIEY